MNGDDTEVFPKVEDAEVSSEDSTEARDHESRLAAFDRAASREADQEAADGEEPGEQQPKPASHKRKRSPWVSALTVVGVLALVCTCTTVGLALGLEHRYENKVTREDILGDLPRADVPLGTKTAPMNFLMLGSDDMSGKNQNIDDPDGSRSDTIMLIHSNAAHNKAFILSIPRDSLVDVPAGGNWKGGPNKINESVRVRWREAVGEDGLQPDEDSVGQRDDREFQRDRQDGRGRRHGQRLRPVHGLVHPHRTGLDGGLSRHGAGRDR